MDFSLSDDQRAFQATARQFAREAMMPNARDWDENETKNLVLRLKKARDEHKATGTFSVSVDDAPLERPAASLAMNDKIPAHQAA